MKFNRFYFVIFLLILITFFTSFLLYNKMPSYMASHWNEKGEVNGYSSKLFGLFFMPSMLLGLFILFLLIPKIDPLKKNIEEFRKYYDIFILLFIIFMVVIHLQIILWNLGFKLNPNFLIPISIGILFFYTGLILEKSKRNWFIGIRTPWTLSSDIVWNKTHKFGGALFKISGLFALVGIFFKNLSYLFVIIPVTISSLIVTVYSYFEFRKLNR